MKDFWGCKVDWNDWRLYSISSLFIRDVEPSAVESVTWQCKPLNLAFRRKELWTCSSQNKEVRISVTANPGLHLSNKHIIKHLTVTHKYVIRQVCGLLLLWNWNENRFAENTEERLYKTRTQKAHTSLLNLKMREKVSCTYQTVNFSTEMFPTLCFKNRHVEQLLWTMYHSCTKNYKIKFTKNW